MSSLHYSFRYFSTLLTFHSSNAALETIVHTTVNNEYTKKKASNFLVPSVDSQLEALIHYCLASLLSQSLLTDSYGEGQLLSL